MSTYTWKIESVNIDTGAVEVAYDFEGLESRLNLPMPDEGADIAAWVDLYAPRTMWTAKAVTVEVGTTGTGEAELPEAATRSESPNTVGSWQEEYLRALIYTVLEEVRESSV
jgi:hypothetical protein